MAQSSNIRAGRAYVEVTAETSKLKANLDGAKAQLQNFSRACASLGKEMMTLGGALSLPLVLAEQSFAGFDDKMRLVKAVTEATGEEFESLTKLAQKLGRETSFTAQQVADAMIGLGRMGFNPSEIEKATAHVLNLSRATGTELAEASDIAANSLRMFGLKAESLSDVTDTLTATANGSAQTLTDLFEGLKMAGPQAAAAGETLSEVCASLGVMANMGIKGSLAGTALRKAYIQFADTKVQDTLKEVGVEAIDSSGNLRKMAEVMRDIALATSKMPTAERLSFMKEVFDIRGMMSGLGLTGNIEELDTFLSKLKDVKGQAADTAAAMDRGIGGSFRLFQSAVEGSMNAVGEALSGALQPISQKITAIINGFTKFVEANGDLVVSIGKCVIGVTGLGAALFSIGTASRVFSFLVAGLSTTVGSLSSVFTLLTSKGILVANSFSIMRSAFAAYSNSATPALVGTSRLLTALNLPIDSRAKQIAASLVMMSNAEAAAAAKSAIASRFNTLIATMRSLNAATITATISTKAHAAAETIASVASKAATAAHVALVAVSGALTKSHAKAALGATAAGVANVALAATTKVVASGYLAASAAAAAFCAIPISWVLVAIVGSLAGLCAYMSKAGKHTASLSDEMMSLREKGDDLRSVDELRMARLKQLAEKEKLSNAEMKEAEKLSSALKSRYGDIGYAADTAASSISLAADAMDRFNEAMKRQALMEVGKEIKELEDNIADLRAENDSLCSFWVNAWNTITFRMNKSSDDIKANAEKVSEYLEKLSDARKRQRSILSGEEGSLTGGKSERDGLEDKIQKTESEKHASQEEAEKAAKKLADIEKKLTREQQSELQNEISDIKELRDEYKELVKTMLSYEMSKREKDAEKIADLEGRLAEADAVAERRIATAEEKARKKFDDEIKDLQESFDESAEDISRRRAEALTDRKIDDALKADSQLGIKLLTDLITNAKIAAQNARSSFDELMRSSAADGEISSEEEKRLRKAEEAYSLAEGLVDKYSSKLEAAQDALTRRANSVRPEGTFYARAAENMHGNQLETRRTQAAEEIVRQTKRTNQLLKSMDGSGSSLTFT